MLPTKLSAALAGALLISGVAAAQSTSTFPMSVNDSGPNYPVASDGRTYNPFGRFAGGRQAVEPSQVDEAHPGHTAGQAMPSMEGRRGATGTAGSGTRAVPGPASVDESHTGHTGGQAMPSMRQGR